MATKDARSSERLYRQLLEESPVLVGVLDLGGCCVLASPSLAETLGYERHEITGRSALDFVEPSQRAAVARELEGVRQRGRVRGSVGVATKAGGHRTLLIDARRHDQDEEGAFVFFSATDVTEQIAAERSAVAANLQQRQLITALPSILIGLDVEGAVTLWNAAAERAFGLSRDATLGRGLLDLSLDWDADLQELLEQATEGGVASADNVPTRFPDGSDRLLGVTVNPVTDEHDAFAGLLILAADVTERRRMQTQLSQAQKLESIGQLAAGIAHEINTPTQYVGDNVDFLRSAFGDLNALLDSYDALLGACEAGGDVSTKLTETRAAVEDADLDFLRKEIPEALAHAGEGLERVSKIVRAMKSFSHPGTESKTTVNLNESLESTITVANNEWKYVADLEKTLDENLPLVNCLPGELNQVFLNLLVNAAHAIGDVVGDGSGDKGTIRVSTQRRGDDAEIRISDSGCGMPEHVRQRIFDPFFTTKAVGRGTGQGLSIAHKVVVEDHGGSIDVESEEGVGTTFTIRLPIGAQAEADDEVIG